MIQRIQTLYLLCFIAIVTVFLIANCEISSGFIIGNEINSGFFINSLKTIFLGKKNASSTNWGIIISQSACAILAFVAIFSFRDLRLQKKLLFLNHILILISSFFIIWTHFKVVSTFENLTILHYSYCLLLPLSLFLFNFLSIRGITKDIDLLASADRLR